MQIHELTQPRLDEGIASALGNLVGGARAGASALGQKLSPVGDFKSAMADPMRQQQIKMLSDKVYGGWKAYEKTLLQSNPDAKETPMYEQALLAFVVKNLLGGQYLPNVINKDKITALVKQLSAYGQGPATQTPTAKNPPATKPSATFGKVPSATAPAKPGQMPAGVAKSSQGKKMIKALGTPKGGIQGMQSDLEEASLPDAIKGNIQQWKDTFKGSTPAPNTTTTAAPVAPTTTTATAPKPPAGTLNPQKEKDLWLQLTQQAAVATAHAPGTGGKPSTPGGPSDSDNTGAGDARSYAQQLTPTDPAVATGLKKFSETSAKNIGDTTVKSTGNPIADALLILAGFRGI